LLSSERKHVLPPGGDEFFSDVQRDYKAVLPDDPNTQAGGPVAPDVIGDLKAEIDASGVFETIAVRRYLWDITYTADEYLDVLNTYSGHRALDEEMRGHLLALIRRRIMSRPTATVRKSYLTVLTLARRG